MFFRVDTKQSNLFESFSEFSQIVLQVSKEPRVLNADEWEARGQFVYPDDRGVN